MRCPTCGYENLLGSDVCDNCGSDLAGRDIPEPAIGFRGQLLGEHLDALGIIPPEIVDASTDVDEAIRRMHDKGIDCVLVGRDQQDGGRWVPPHPDRRGRPPDRRRLGPRCLPPPRPVAAMRRTP